MPPERPNLLFFFPDQHRFDWLNFHSDVPVQTPTLDRLAEQGVAFRNAVCPSPLCGPSRACLASGMDYDRCGVRDYSADYPLSGRTYYGRLRDEADYHVMGRGKFDIQKHANDRWGPDGTRNVARNGLSEGINNHGKWGAVGHSSEDGEFTEPVGPYMSYLAEHGLAQAHVDDLARREVDVTAPTPLPDHAYCDNWIARNGLDLLEAAPEGKPWHLVVNFAGPHDPWDVTEEMHGWYRDPDVEFPDPMDPDGPYTYDDAPPKGYNAIPVSAETHQEVRRNYAAMVENVDRWLQQYLALLDERGERDRTLIVFGSDHGELLGDHGQWKKHAPYQSSVGVPLVVSGPVVERRGQVDEPASILDLHATFLEYAGIDPGEIDSRSLRPYLDGHIDTHRDVVYSGLGPWRLAFDGRYKLIKGFDETRTSWEQTHTFDAWNEIAIQNALKTRDPVLFDLQVDPHELTNIAGDNPDIVERLSASLESVRGGS